MTKRCSFALVEVCVALMIMGVVTTYLFTTGFETLKWYRYFHDEVMCQEKADETFATFLASYLITPLEFDAVIAGSDREWVDEDGYMITMCATAEPSSENAKQPAAKLFLTVSVQSPRSQDVMAERATMLCVVKGDLTVKTDRE